MYTKKNFYLLKLTSFLCFLPFVALADEDDPHIELRGVAGITHMSVGESHLHFASPVQRTDTLKKIDTNAFQGGLGAMYVLPVCEECEDDDINLFREIKAGLMAYGFGHTVSGGEVAFEDPNITSGNYDLDIDNFRLMFDASVTVVTWEEWSGFLLGGVGPAWSWVKYNGHSGYNDVSFEIDRHLSTTAAWEVGGGLAYDLTDNLGISVEYLYTNFGNIETGDKLKTSEGNQFAVTPAKFSLHTNTVFVGLAWELW